MGRNIFSPVDYSSIPIEVMSSDNEVVDIHPTVLENLTPNSFINPDILIQDIRLNWNTTTVDVTVAGIKGEVYTLKTSGGNGRGGVRAGDIMFEEQLFIQYSEVYTPLRLSLEENMEYVFTLFDYHNTPQSTFTFIAPANFTYVETTPAQASEDFSIMTPAHSTHLDKTSDSLSIFNITFIAVIIVITLIVLLRGKMRHTL